MSDRDLCDLAEGAGIATQWRGFDDAPHDVAPDALRSVLKALGLPAESAAQVAESRAALAETAADPSPLHTAVVGQPVDLPGQGGRYRLELEDGTVRDGMADTTGTGARLAAIDVPGYHVLELAGHRTTLAVAPPRCWQVADASGGRRLWGLAVQLYSLRRSGDGGLGDFTALGDLVRAAGAAGAGAVAISPVHAQFSADPDRFSPYAPSSRVALNILHADAGAFIAAKPGAAQAAELARLEALDLVDWPAASRARLDGLRSVFEAFHSDAPAEAHHAFDAFRAEGGDVLERHARFEALHAARFSADPGQWHWRDWPEALRDPASPAVAQFAQANAASVAFHAFLQYLADSGLGSAQRIARESGMPIGLIADLAVGTDSGGSHAWSRQAEMLNGLTVGAPPDLLNTRGQNWGVTAFSPRGLLAHGFSAFVEMLRAALRHAGGVRIDHVMGLTRLWVVPDGQPASEGAYLRFPLQDLLRLVALESWRHKAVVLGEDLGTVPEGFREELNGAGLAGLRVLWFEREKEKFTMPGSWTKGGVAMTTTHDLPTVGGWWQARDLDWYERLGDDQSAARARRGDERKQLWTAFQTAGVAGPDEAPQVDPHGAEAVADCAARFIGRSSCDLALLPVEDALALIEQPNLPGTLHEHPNWQRRMPGMAATMLETPRVAARLGALAEARTGA